MKVCCTLPPIVAALLIAAPHASAQSYPQKTVRIIVQVIRTAGIKPL